MNIRNKKLVITLRVLFGAFMAFSGASGLLMSADMEGVPKEMIQHLVALQTTGIFYMIKYTELIAGLMLVLNLYPALATIFLSPVAVGIVIFNYFVAPESLAFGTLPAIFCVYFGYVYWESYKALFKS